MIEVAVMQSVSENSDLEPLRQDIIDKLVQALESDASWVELYGVTGELVPSKATSEGNKLTMGLHRAMEVRSEARMLSPP